MILELPHSFGEYKRAELESGCNYSIINSRPKEQATYPRRPPRRVMRRLRA